MNFNKPKLPRFKARILYGLGTETKPYLARISNFRIVCGVTGAEWMLPSLSFCQSWKVLLQPAKALLDAGYPPDSHWRIDWITQRGASCMFVGTLSAASAIAGYDPNIVLIKRTQIRRFREWAELRISGAYLIKPLPIVINRKKTTKTAVIMTDPALAMWRLATDGKGHVRYLPALDE